MGSSRLRGKVLKNILEKPILLHMVSRVRLAKTVDKVVVITSNNKIDDAIEKVCLDNKIDIYRGSEFDLLDRHYQAALIYKANFIIKIPSDCPLSDPDVIDRVVSLWINNSEKYDYVSNYHPPTFPDGLDVEGCTIEVLKEAWQNAKKEYEREHTFPYIWDQPNKFRIGNVENEHGDMFMSHRWTLDYQEDFDFINAIYINFRNEQSFSFGNILDFLKENGDVENINKRHLGVNWYRHHKGELNTVSNDFIVNSLEVK